MIREKLFALQDPKYRDFQRKLIPNIDPDTIIGVRTPDLRHLAKQLDAKQFLGKLPHRYFEENQLHAFLLERERDFLTAVSEVERFLPYVDNWATCDQLRPRVFRSHKDELLVYILKWLSSEHPYTVRFGMEMLMCHYLDNDFKPEYLKWVAGVQSENYYIRMMQAWYFATALAKQYDAAVIYLENRKLCEWVHQKTIQKSIESFRLTQAQKEYIRSLK